MISSRPETEALAKANALASAGQTQQYLTFALGNESYAAAINAIREILEVPTVTSVPLVPSFVRGVINLRGAVVPVIDLSSRFELGPTELARRSCVVVVEVTAREDSKDPDSDSEGQVLGVLVDAVHEVLEIASADIEPAPALGTRIHPDFIRGMAKVSGRLLVVLNLGRVLAQQELAKLVAGHVTS
jgi:purine-binding chemotaxis protein CheW